jgi:hypothetical protein
MEASLSSVAATLFSMAATSPKPSLVLCFLQPVEKVVVDLLKPGHLVGIGPKLWASDTCVFMDAGGAVVAGADPEGDFAELEVSLH